MKRLTATSHLMFCHGSESHTVRSTFFKGIINNTVCISLLKWPKIFRSRGMEGCKTTKCHGPVTIAWKENYCNQSTTS
ncbi:hypothetical protein EG68_00561 [Paragonimus skrjabini miyazakii]|uniref:Uncharacterized protein n=1 Tax=Paragonimus skrjabini miyazakii TaxID=59628 RepID=A0A8S9Z3Z8_9TREM|nr:hypothetical protein EG68_00561 [Paragonimus skrjabini miyazakii]